MTDREVAFEVLVLQQRLKLVAGMLDPAIETVVGPSCRRLLGADAARSMAEYLRKVQGVALEGAVSVEPQRLRVVR